MLRKFVIILVLMSSSCCRQTNAELEDCAVYQPIYAADKIEADELTKMAIAKQIEVHNKIWEQNCLD